MGLAFVFPGQGSQSVGMMAAYGDSSILRATFDEASAALSQDLWRLLADGPAEALAQTVNTQPVMLTAGVAVYRLWLDRGGRPPAVVAGHSLGEYSALVAAGVIAFADAVPLVRLRAAAMQEAVPVGAGAMAAILGLDDEKIAEACAEAAAEAGDGQVVEPVNFNGPGQTVIAGSKAAVARACEGCKARGAKRALLLPVSAPFHSSLIRPAADKLAARLAELSFAAPQFPLINNADVAIESDPVRIKDALIRQAYSPVRWVETMRKMAAMDITTVAECGPGKVLAGLVKRCAPTLAGVALADLAAIEAGIANLEQGLMTLDGEVALVTGASRGIGEAVALELGRLGATVIGTATTVDGAARISAALRAAGSKGEGAVLEVRDAAQVDALISSIEKTHGAVSVLVNNAGITRDNLSMRLKDDEWEAVLDTNLKAVFRLCRAVMRGMMKARRGRIINVTSVVGHAGNAGQANYCAAKAGVAGMSRALARELGSRNITVNCVAPGLIDTDMTRALDDKQRDALLSGIPLARLGSPQEVAAAVSFLASPGAGYVTGTTIHVNGGMFTG